MATGEYVSVSSQTDTEKADIAREKAEIDADPAEELRALVEIYDRRGVPTGLALQVAAALHEEEPLGAHVRDELGVSAHIEAQPLSLLGLRRLPLPSVLPCRWSQRRWCQSPASACG